MLLKVILTIISVPLLNCCNLYNDFCDDMEKGYIDNIRVRRQAMDYARQLNISQEEMGRRVSRTLDTLFNHGYNKQLRPGIGHAPTQVEVNIAIRSV